jgi:hypothetical protein
MDKRTRNALDKKGISTVQDILDLGGLLKYMGLVTGELLNFCYQFWK